VDAPQRLAADEPLVAAASSTTQRPLDESAAVAPPRAT